MAAPAAVLAMRLLAKHAGKALARQAARSVAKRTAKKAIGVGGALSRVGKHANKAISKVYEVGWAIDALMSLGDKFFPRVIKECRVTVAGSQAANIGRLFHLAIAIASSKMRKVDGKEWPGCYDQVFIANIDYTEKVVDVTICYSVGAALGKVTAGTQPLIDMRLAPPDTLYASNQWPWFMSNVIEKPGEGFIPGPPILAPDPQLTYTGFKEVALQKPPGINPFPVGDGISRSTDLVALMAQTLNGPCKQADLKTSPRYVMYKAVENATVGPGAAVGLIKSLQLPFEDSKVVPQ